MKNIKETTVTVIGLGYVGLPTLILCAQKGFHVIGVDIDDRKIKSLEKGEIPIKEYRVLEKDLKKFHKNINFTKNTVEAVRNSDIIIVAVPTPVDEEKKPNLNYLTSAVKEIAKGLKSGSLVIIESTVPPGTCESVVKPILETFGLRAGEDFYLAHCPHRLDPGNKKYTLKNIPRVLGALSERGLRKALAFYKMLLETEIYPMHSIKEAEAVKVLENAFRDINIAFVNEVAKLFDQLGIDLREVIKGASTKPFGFLPHWPGIGVGGECIGVASYFLLDLARKKNIDLELVKVARKVNESMPYYTLFKLFLAFNRIKTVSYTHLTLPTN